MDAIKTSVRSPHRTLPGRKLEPFEELHSRIRELLRNDGEPEAYIALYYDIPAYDRNWRSQFYRRIFKQASRKNWNGEKTATVLSGICR